MEFGHIVKGINCNNVLNNIHAYNNQIYENIADYPMTAKRYSLGKCNLTDSAYVINDVYDMRIPPIYAKELGCCFLTYYKGYFAFPLELKVCFYKYNGEPAGCTSVGHDGSRIDALDKLKVTPVPLRVPFTVSANLDGDIVEHINFTLVEQTH